MNDKIKTILPYIFVLTIGVAFGKFGLPGNVVEKEHIVFQDRILTKEVETKDIVKQDNKIVTRTETTKPDGTNIVQTTITDKDKTITDDNVKKDTDQQTSTITDKEKTTTYNHDSLMIALGVNTHVAYSLTIQKRVIGPFFIGVYGDTERVFGANVGLSF